jgi:hypothetical protein
VTLSNNAAVFFRRILTLLVLLPFSTGIAAEFTLVPERPKIQDPAIKEASGLAASSYDPNFLWIINDSGGAPEVHLTEINGTARGKVRLKNVTNIDWEDLASFSLDGQNYLLIADTGDNNSKRSTCKLYIIREPDIPAPGKTLDETTLPTWQIEFNYQGGPRDCEAVAVDASTGKILLVSKRTQPPEVYEIPLRAPRKSGVITLKSIGQTEVKSPGGTIVPMYDQPTGLDIAAEGTAAAITTYYGVFLFSRAPKESWAQAFTRPAIPLGSHLLGQAESVAFSKNGKTIYATSEGPQAPIARYQK